MNNITTIFFDIDNTLLNHSGSEEIGYAKPAKEIFLHAQALSKTTPKNILFIGDNPVQDIEPGKKMGWNVLLFDYFNIYAKQEAIRDFKMILDHG